MEPMKVSFASGDLICGLPACGTPAFGQMISINLTRSQTEAVQCQNFPAEPPMFYKGKELPVWDLWKEF